MWEHDLAYEQELASTKYAGQPYYELSPEEAARAHPMRLLASGEWRFEIGLSEADAGNRELLNTPVSTKVQVYRNGESEYEILKTVEEVTITSIRITPLSVEFSFEIPEPADRFSAVSIDASSFGPMPAGSEANYSPPVLVLNGGTEISMFQYNGASDAAMMLTGSPVILDEIAYLRFSDGTIVSASQFPLK